MGQFMTPAARINAAIELMENEALIIAARLEFETKRGADFEYDSLLGDRPPPLDYRN